MSQIQGRRKGTIIKSQQLNTCLYVTLDNANANASRGLLGQDYQTTVTLYQWIARGGCRWINLNHEHPHATLHNREILHLH